MALYQGLQQHRDDEAPAPRWRELQASTRNEAQGNFLDRLLGEGSTQVLGRAVGTAIGSLRRGATKAEAARPALLQSRRAPLMQSKRMEAVGSGEAPLPRGRKGVIRGFLMVLGLLWAVAMLKPWQRAGELNMDLAALFSAPDPAADAKRALEKRRRESLEAARLAALPLIPASGEPLGLWQDGRGQWYSVDANGGLAPGEAPGRRASLGLVQLRGVAALSEPKGQGRSLRLDLPEGLLKDLLPLQPGVASEAQALLLSDKGEPVILTHDGARCLLSLEGWEKQQARLALVLADLAARRRRASLIDLRYDDSAVVRPAGR